MRPATILTSVAGIGIVVALIVAGGQRLRTDTQQTAAADEATSPPFMEAAPAPTTDPAASMNARPIDDASQFYPASVDGKPLERVAAAIPETPKVKADNGVDLPRPVAESAGILGFGDRRLQLAEIEATPADKVCNDTDGGEWPCGMLAKTNFRLFLRLRTVHCDLDSASWSGTTSASCKIGAQDISRWLVENGWAAPSEGSSLADIGKTAKDEKKGIYGDDPRKGDPLTPATEPLPEGLPDPL